MNYNISHVYSITCSHCWLTRGMQVCKHACMHTSRTQHSHTTQIRTGVVATAIKQNTKSITKSRLSGGTVRYACIREAVEHAHRRLSRPQRNTRPSHRLSSSVLLFFVSRVFFSYFLVLVQKQFRKKSTFKKSKKKAKRWDDTYVDGYALIYRTGILIINKYYWSLNHQTTKIACFSDPFLCFILVWEACRKEWRTTIKLSSCVCSVIMTSVYTSWTLPYFG